LNLSLRCIKAPRQLQLRPVLPRVKSALQGSLYMPRLCDIQYGELYIDKNLSSVPLGVTEDDIDADIGDYEALRRYP
jgi:hypothetical protein